MLFPTLRLNTLGNVHGSLTRALLARRLEPSRTCSSA